MVVLRMKYNKKDLTQIWNSSWGCLLREWVRAGVLSAISNRILPPSFKSVLEWLFSMKAWQVPWGTMDMGTGMVLAVETNCESEPA